MKCALIDCTVPEEAERHSIFAAIFRGERHSRRERNVRADDGVTAIHVIFFVEEMHRTAEPTRATGFLAKQLGHAGIGAGAARERVCVIAIRRDDVIVVAHRRNRTRHQSFLPDIEMTEAANLLRLILLARTFFETTDQQHQREHLDLVALLGPLHR